MSPFNILCPRNSVFALCRLVMFFTFLGERADATSKRGNTIEYCDWFAFHCHWKSKKYIQTTTSNTKLTQAITIFPASHTNRILDKHKKVKHQLFQTVSLSGKSIDAKWILTLFSWCNSCLLVSRNWINFFLLLKLRSFNLCVESSGIWVMLYLKVICKMAERTGFEPAEGQ